MSDYPRIVQAIQADLWAIRPEWLETIVSIAQGYGEPEAVAAKLGRPLENTRKTTRRDSVAVIPVTGPIFRYANLFTEISGATSVQTLATDFNAALADQSVDRIVLEIDSPGGQVAGISEFAEMVHESTKPVTAYVSDVGASAAYWIAAAAKEIVIRDTARIGSIGVVSKAVQGATKGEIKIVSTQSPLKQADPSTDAGRALMQAEADALAEVFIGAVAKYRNVPREKVLSDFGQGGVLVGETAVNAGMADRLGSLEFVIAGASGTTQTRGTAMATAEKPITRELIAAEHPDIAAAFRAEGHAEGLAVGAKTERERIQAVHSTPLGHAHKDLIASLMFDGKTTGPEAALAVLAAEEKARTTHRDKIAADAPSPVPHAEAPQDPKPADEKPKSAAQIANEAAAYQAEQSKLGVEVSLADAVLHITNGKV